MLGDDRGNSFGKGETENEENENLRGNDSHGNRHVGMEEIDLESATSASVPKPVRTANLDHGRINGDSDIGSGGKYYAYDQSDAMRGSYDVEATQVHSYCTRHCAKILGHVLLAFVFGLLLGGKWAERYYVEYPMEHGEENCDDLLGAKVEHDFCYSHPDNEVLISGNDKQTNFLVVGDWGRDGLCCQRDVAYEMSRAAEAIAAKFVISTGDNFYPVGIPDESTLQVETSWLDVYYVDSFSNGKKNYLREQELDWYSVLGNHDYVNNPENEIGLDTEEKGKGKFPYWKMPKRHFQISKGTLNNDTALVEFFFIDTTPIISAYQSDHRMKEHIESGMVEEYVKDLDDQLAASKSHWKIVVGHHPVYTVGEHYPETVEMRSRIQPILEKHDVAIYFCGHDHDLQHLRNESSSTHYFVSGAGSKIRAIAQERGDWANYHSGRQGFLAVTMDEKQIEVHFLDLRGSWNYHAIIAHPSTIV